MTSVQLTDAGRIRIDFEPDEATMLADLAGQIADLITDAPHDSAFTRLFPPAYRDDSAAAAEFERFERAGLAEGKVNAARTVHAAASVGELDPGEIVEVELDDDDVWPWLTHLTDVRSVLADRLGIEDDDSEIQPDDELLTLLPLYDWLGWLQGAIIAALESLEVGEGAVTGEGGEAD
ncbi:DUF2017 family protein [Leifsonia flava]|uniref:DUF2017 family protein n=1 Tax=Orlajensenia leifsoniae TaxID=2561933 RepID=A0A4Y9R157_9MICO|nr:DUF2017 family protein [Leifsonia flava]TFV98399.1 DUF2017 family protein [Leifsonia flava]